MGWIRRFCYTKWVWQEAQVKVDFSKPFLLFKRNSSKLRKAHKSFKILLLLDVIKKHLIKFERSISQAELSSNFNCHKIPANPFNFPSLKASKEEASEKKTSSNKGEKGFFTTIVFIKVSSFAISRTRRSQKINKLNFNLSLEARDGFCLRLSIVASFLLELTPFSEKRKRSRKKKMET